MNIYEWKERFTERHMETLLQYHLEEQEAEQTEGPDFFKLENEKMTICYQFNEEKALLFQDALPNGWFVTDCTEVSGYETKTIVEIQSGNEILVLTTQNADENSQKNILHIEYYGKECTSSEVRNLIFFLRSTFFPETAMTAESIKRIFSQKELEEKFGACIQHFYTTIDELPLSVRAYVCLSHEKYKTVFDIAWDTPENIYRINKLGNRSYREIVKIIDDLGVPWNMEKKIVELFTSGL